MVQILMNTTCSRSPPGAVAAPGLDLTAPGARGELLLLQDDPRVAAGAGQDGRTSTNAVHGAALPCVLRHLPPNDKATTGRLICKDAAFWLGSVPDRTVDISEPLPAHVAASAQRSAPPHLHGMPLQRKLLWLAAAAASGGGANVQVAWRALEPKLFPGLLQSNYYTALFPDAPDPGAAAVEAGHAQLVPQLLDLCPGLIRPTELLAAVAHHQELTGPYGLQAMWDQLKRAYPQLLPSILSEQCILEAALSSKHPDAEDKVAWLVKHGTSGTRGVPWDSWYEPPYLAAQAGGLDRLVSFSSRFLGDGDDDDDDDDYGAGAGAGLDILRAALEHCDVGSVQWLLDTGRCELPKDASYMRNGARFLYRENLESWERLLSAAARSEIDGVPKMELLWHHVWPVDADWVFALPAQAAAESGRLDCLRHLHDRAREAIMAWNASTELTVQAVKSESMEVVAWLRLQGYTFSCEALVEACSNGSLAMVEWLLQEAKVQPRGVDLGANVIAEWPYKQQGDSGRLLQAVKLLVAAAASTAPVPAAAPGDDADAPRQWGTALPAAASRGDLGLVRYLVEELQLQEELSAEVFSAAAGSGCEALLEWLVREQGCPVSGPDAWVRAGRLGDRAVLECLLRLGVPWGQGLEKAVVEAGLPEPVLKWMEAEGAPWRMAGQQRRGSTAQRRK